MAEIMENDRNLSGRATAGLTTGIIGTALGLLGGNLGNWFNGNNGTHYVTQDEASKSAEISALNSKIALLEAEKGTDSKLVDVYERIASRTLELERDICKFKGEQAVVNAQIGSQIAVSNANISCLQNQLSGLTKVVIPNTSVCPGWGNATVSVSTTA